MSWDLKRRKRKRLWGIVFALGVCFILGKALVLVLDEGVLDARFWEEGENAFFAHFWNHLYPAPGWEGEQVKDGGWEKGTAENHLEEVRKLVRGEEDPAYRSARAAQAFFQEHQYLEIYGGEESGGLPEEGVPGEWILAGGQAEEAEKTELSEESNQNKMTNGGALAASGVAYPGKLYSLAQLEDYDFLMKHFYNVHTSTTADRDLMDVKAFLRSDFRLKKEEDALPQILIYHTHSQEAFADSQEGETIVEVGEYLAQCLTEKGFSVYHDSSAYDVRDGKLDRNKAYRYALEGLTTILEENPSIQVVIDLHRDGVGANTHLVTEVNGKPTAQIMLFNGLSQTPDGPVPYLENKYRKDNLAFSLQLQLKAAAWYPGFARKIYLKGLRYNQHLRPCSCLVEVGAQTNTFQEAKNAMEPLADIFSMVLR